MRDKEAVVRATSIRLTVSVRRGRERNSTGQTTDRISDMELPLPRGGADHNGGHL